MSRYISKRESVREFIVSFYLENDLFEITQIPVFYSQVALENGTSYQLVEEVVQQMIGVGQLKKILKSDCQEKEHVDDNDYNLYIDLDYDKKKLKGGDEKDAILKEAGKEA